LRGHGNGFVDADDSRVPVLYPITDVVRLVVPVVVVLPAPVARRVARPAALRVLLRVEDPVNDPGTGIHGVIGVRTAKSVVLRLGDHSVLEVDPLLDVIVQDADPHRPKTGNTRREPIGNACARERALVPEAEDPREAGADHLASVHRDVPRLAVAG